MGADVVLDCSDWVLLDVNSLLELGFVLAIWNPNDGNMSRLEPRREVHASRPPSGNARLTPTSWFSDVLRPFSSCANSLGSVSLVIRRIVRFTTMNLSASPPYFRTDQAGLVELSMTGRTVGHLGRLSCRFEPDIDKMRGRFLRGLRNADERLR